MLTEMIPKQHLFSREIVLGKSRAATGLASVERRVYKKHLIAGLGEVCDE